MSERQRSRIPARPTQPREPEYAKNHGAQELALRGGSYRREEPA